MSQNDMIIADADGATVLADMSDAFQALASTSKGNSRPSTAYPGQFWIDDNTPSATVWTLYMYDGSDDIAMGYWDTTNNVFIPAGIGAGTATIASNATVDLGSTPETSITISGTTTITSFGSSMLPGQAKIVTFSGALTLTHNATSLILPSGANITTAANDRGIVLCLSTGNYAALYFRASGAPVSTSLSGVAITGSTIDMESVLGGAFVTTADFNKTSSTVLSDITGLSATLVAGETYEVEATLYTASNSASGVKFGQGGTATATAFVADGYTIDSTAIASRTRQGSVGQVYAGVTAVTAALFLFRATIVVNAGGTFTLQFAQNTSGGTASTVLRGSTMKVRRIS